MHELLDIVNENDEVIGTIYRDAPDRAGKLFRMVFVGFYTPEKNIILQRRSMLKTSSPGLLTTTVSGHVSSGQSYDEAAIRETLEETGVIVDETKLQRLGVVVGRDAMRAVYAYPYSLPVDTLTIEEDEGDGFISIPVADLQKDREEYPERYAPFISGTAGTTLLDYIEHVAA